VRSFAVSAGSPASWWPPPRYGRANQRNSPSRSMLVMIGQDPAPFQRGACQSSSSTSPLRASPGHAARGPLQPVVSHR
jgi:hypothetical protein